MIPASSGVCVWLSVGRTDIRHGMNGLALQVQETLGRNPFAGDLFLFRRQRGDLITILWHGGLGRSFYAKHIPAGTCGIAALFASSRQRYVIPSRHGFAA